MRKNKQKRQFSLGAIVTSLILLFGIATAISTYYVLKIDISRSMETNVLEKLSTDIQYMQDIINPDGGSWSEKDGYLYYGDVCLGNGTQETAYIEPFTECESKTGTFCYVFIKCSDEGLGYVDATETTLGYYEGHYLRVAGSTLDPNGNSIVGTYITKNIADSLDETDYYSGESNVAGGLIYCIYQTIRDENNEVIGAVVVGRSISAIHERIAWVIHNIAAVLLVVFSSMLFTIIYVINNISKKILNISMAMEELSGGEIPALTFDTTGCKEIEVLARSFNNTLNMIAENNILRERSETDELTKIPNRLGMEIKGKEMLNFCTLRNKPMAVWIIDIDYFKELNDNYGHPVGDECLKSVAKILRSFRVNGNLCPVRFGGDEFVLLVNSLSLKDTEALAKEIKERILAANIMHRYTKVEDINCITLSQGICWGYPKENNTLDDFLKISDKALYSVKDSGKNGYCIINLENEVK